MDSITLWHPSHPDYNRERRRALSTPDGTLRWWFHYWEAFAEDHAAHSSWIDNQDQHRLWPSAEHRRQAQDAMAELDGHFQEAVAGYKSARAKWPDETQRFDAEILAYLANLSEYDRLDWPLLAHQRIGWPGSTTP